MQADDEGIVRPLPKTDHPMNLWRHSLLLLGYLVPVVILAKSIAVSMITFNNGKTNILLGAIHLVLFATYIMLIFDDV